jgi:hypothetical protein
MLPAVIDLAWAATGGDARAVEEALEPETGSMHLALARFFARQGKTIEAIAQFRAAGDVSNEEQRALLRELLAARRFREAYEVWTSIRRARGEGDVAGAGPIVNGGFEESLRLDDPGFGWQLARTTQAVQASHDTVDPRVGRESLRLVWSGNSDPASPVLSQLVLVEPNARYQLHFAARTEKIVTGALPVVAVIDADSNERRNLAQPLVLPQGTSSWQDYTMELTTAKETGAIQINLRRQDCGDPCPIFGQIWLDDFSLRKIS